MKKILKPLTLVLLAAIIVIQFFHPEKNIQLVESSKDISAVVSIPSNVQLILQTSCYDCHSNNTKYPWYASIQPVAWWLNDHIEEGKKEINFNEYATYSPRRQFKKLNEIIEQVKEDEMPLGSYTLIHKNAQLNEGQKKELINWATAQKDTMMLHYPADSLKRKK